jgi:broad specificity phosphatase PhoE
VTKQPPPGAPASLEPAPGEPRGSIIPDDLDATLVLLRHGESEWVARGLFQGQGDSPLSPLGQHQADLAAARLAGRGRPPSLPIPLTPPLETVHSPLLRTTDTAARVAVAVGEPALRPDPGFLEIGQGEWEGLPGATIVERWGLILDGWRRDPLSAWAPGGESLPEVHARVTAALRDALGRLAAADPTPGEARSPVLGYREPVGTDPWSLVVGHDGVFKVTLLTLLDLPLARFWTFPFALCGITIVQIRAGRPRLRLHNWTEHLAPVETEELRQRDAERARAGAL